MQAESATLIGQAIQQNPAFLTLRKIEVSQDKPTLNVRVDLAEWDSCSCCQGNLLISLCLQAAREIAGTIATANNRVLLNSESLLLNLVSHCPPCFLSITDICEDTDNMQQ
jgi:prohibitin 2